MHDLLLHWVSQMLSVVWIAILQQIWLWTVSLAYTLPSDHWHCWHCTMHSRCFCLKEVESSGYFLPGMYLWCCILESTVNPRTSRFSLTLFSRSFIVLHSISCTVIRFELVLRKMWGICLCSFILCVVLCLFQGHLLNRLCSSSVLNWLVLHESTSEFSVLIHSLTEFSVLSLEPWSVDYWMYLLFWLWIVYVSPPVSTHSLYCAFCSGPFSLHRQFTISLTVFTECIDQL